MHTLTTLIISSLSLFIVRIAMIPSPAAAAAMADSLEPTDYNTPLATNNKCVNSTQKATMLTNLYT